MATQRGRYSTAPNPIAQGNVAAQQRIAYARSLQRQDATSANDNATQAMAATVPRYALPAGGAKGMSPADQANIARSVAIYQNGGHMPANTPIMGRNAPTAPVAVAPTFDKDGNLKSPPVNAPGTAPSNQTALGGAFRGSTPEEIQAFRDSAPGSASSPAALATAANAGKGNEVKTPYGTVSSTDVKNGPGANWQQQLVSKYPTLGIAGHPDNVAFVKAYKDAAKNGTPDHVALADNIVGPNSDQPTLEGQVPQFGVPNALQPQNRTASTAARIGKTIHDTPGVVSKTVGDAVGGVIKSTVGAAKDFYANLTGNPNANTGPNSIDPPVIPGGTQSPKQIAYNSAKAGLDAQNTAGTDTGSSGAGGSFVPTTPPMYTGTDSSSTGTGGSFSPTYQPQDAHADIHAATVGAITKAGQNAHNAVNSGGTSLDGVSPATSPYPPQPAKNDNTAGY